MNEEQRIQEYLRIKNNLKRHIKTYLELPLESQAKLKPLVEEVLKEFNHPELNNLKFKSNH